MKNGAKIKAIFNPRRLGHVNLVVKNTDESMGFYRNIVGFEEVYRVVAILGGFLSNGNTHHDIGMVQSSGTAGGDRPSGLNHLAFELESEIELLKGYEKAIEQNVEIQRTLDHDIAHSVYIADPDGNSCELYADVIKDWRNARTGRITKPKPKWWPGATEPISESMYDPNPEICRVENALFHPKKTTHATLLVNDLQKSLEFYLNVIGLNILSGCLDIGYVHLSGSTKKHCLTLVQKTRYQVSGMHHVAFLVEDLQDLESSINKLKKRTHFLMEKIIETNYSLCVYIKDIDGIRLKFYSEKQNKKPADYQDNLWL